MSERRGTKDGPYDWLPAKGGGKSRDAEGGDSTHPPTTRGNSSRSRKRKKTGKRSNPAYVQRSFYVPDKVDRRVRQALLAEEERISYSDFVTNLMVEWLEEVGWALDDEDEHSRGG